MISFSNVHPDVVKVLKQEGIQESDLFNHYSDLYVGCKDMTQAGRILSSGTWRGLSTVFKPQKGSDMEKYPAAVDIAFGAVGQDLADRDREKTNRQIIQRIQKRRKHESN